jgi:hypothetical protein
MKPNGTGHRPNLRSMLPVTLVLLCVLLTACCGSCRYQGRPAPTPQPNRSPVLTSIMQAGVHPFN